MKKGEFYLFYTLNGPPSQEEIDKGLRAATLLFMARTGKAPTAFFLHPTDQRIFGTEEFGDISIVADVDVMPGYIVAPVDNQTFTPGHNLERSKVSEE